MQVSSRTPNTIQEAASSHPLHRHVGFLIALGCIPLVYELDRAGFWRLMPLLDFSFGLCIEAQDDCLQLIR